MARRRYRKPFKFRLKKATIYTLSAIVLFVSGLVLLFSFTKNGPSLTLANTYLTHYFGVLSVLVPLNLIFISFIFLKIRSRFTKPNIPIGFFTFTVSSLGLFQSGVVGREIFFYGSTLWGKFINYIVFTSGALIGFIVFLNISFPQIFKIISFCNEVFVGIVKNILVPFFKTRRPIFVKNIKPIAIKGMKEQQEALLTQTTRVNITNQQKPIVKKEDLGDELILNKPLQLGLWEYPPLSLLSDHHDKKRETQDVKKIAGVIEKTLQSFGIQSRVVEINVGPAVTQHAIEIALGTKVSKITALANDLALATEAPTGQVRIVAPIPGRNLVGIEIPNKSLQIVALKTMLSSSQIQRTKSKLALPLGLDVSGIPVIAEISKMPHVLIAGTTGSGKSVLINAFIASLLFRASPSEVRFILIDPKRVELTGYNNIPHLLVPVVVEPTQAVSALKWALKEMDRRYVKFAESGVKNIDSYNELSGFQALPYIVIFIDELADLMALSAVEVEDSIARLAQMARATGIHLILSTQRPSVDVLTGLIKANIPCRIAFNVSSMIDSKVIIDTPGAEKLLGRGDMLYVPPDQAKPTRIQGAFVSEQDVKRVVNFIRSRGMPIQYTQEVLEQEVHLRRGVAGGANGDRGARDPLFEQAVRIVCQYDRASSSLLQRRLQIGFNKAARILEQLEEAGIVGPADGAKPREVLIKNPEEILSQQ